MTIVIMGVSGCGKTTIGKRVAEKISLPFYDADDFHPPENVAKMKSGIPLNDLDREPWLTTLADHLLQMEKTGGSVLACSALKVNYREQLLGRLNPASTFLVYLKGDSDLIVNRLRLRNDHYMPTELLESQFRDLEEPEPGDAIILPTHHSPETIVQQLLTILIRHNLS